MSQNPEDKKANQKKGGRRKTLQGKVVLLIGSDASFLQTIVSRLAQEGADIALICQQQVSLKTVSQIRETVEALGRRFLFLAEARYKVHSPSWLIQIILANLGHLDVFIDLSSPKSTEANANAMGSSESAAFSKWELTQAALEAIAAT